MTDMTAFERRVADGMVRRAGPVRPVDDLAIFEAVIAASRSQRWGFDMFSALKYIAAGVIVALFGGFLLAGILTTPQDGKVPPAALTESPEPEVTSEPTEAADPSVRTDLLPGVALTVEEVEPGVHRVVDDGVRDLTAVAAMEVAAGYDGGIRLLRGSDFLRLGSDETHQWPDVPRGDDAFAFEVAPDGTMWVIPCGSGWHYTKQCGDARRSTDGEEWTLQPCPEGSLDCQGFTVASDGTVWATWRVSGSKSRGQWAVGQLGPTGWQPLDGYARYDSTPFRGYRRMWVTEAGDVYGVGYDNVYRYEDGDWGNVAPRGWFTLADVGPDGTIWLGNNDGLARFADGEWEAWRSDDILGTSHGFGNDGGDIHYDYLGEMGFEVAPDGSLWFSPWRMRDRTEPLVCDGLVRFDGRTLDRFLPGRCISSVGIATDGSVWVLAGDEAVWAFDAGPAHWVLDDDEGRDLYVITPEAVPRTDSIDIRAVTTTTSDILPGVTLAAEEIEPGIFRVVSDGARDVTQVTMTAVGKDGSVWVDSASGIVQLGRAGDHPGLVDGEGFLTFAEDGTLWAASGDAPVDLRSFDGEAWTQRGKIPEGTASLPDRWVPADYITDFAVHPDGTVWQIGEGEGHHAKTRVQHLGTDAWTTYAIGSGLPDLGWCGICVEGEECEEECEGGWETLEITPDGTVWVGVPPKHPYVPRPSGGLFRFDGDEWEVVRPLGGDDDYGVSGLLADPTGVLWAAIETGDLLRFDGDEWEVVRPLGSGQDHSVVDWVVNRDGVLWVEFETGHLARFDGGAWEAFSYVRRVDPGLGGSRAVDPDGSLWVGWEDHPEFGIDGENCSGVRRLDGSTWTTYLPGLCVADIDVASDGAVWVTLPGDDSLWWVPGYGVGGDLYVITPEAAPESVTAVDTMASPTTTSDILPGVALIVEEVEPGVFRVISDGMRDVEQVRLAHVTDDGSVLVDSAEGTYELGRPGEHPDLVDAGGSEIVAEDGALRATSGAGDGQSLNPDETRDQQGSVPDGITSVPDPWWPADYITDSAVHPDGTIWQMAEQEGDDAHTRVQHLGTDTWTTHDIRDDLYDLGWCGICDEGEPCSAANCEGGWSIEIMPDGMVWVGVPPRHPPVDMPSGGLVRFDGGEWDVVRPLGGDQDYGVGHLVADRDGILWAAFETGDLARFDGADWETVRPPSVDPDRSVVDLTSDRDGGLWVEFEGGHLARYHGGAWEVFSYAPTEDVGLGGIRTVDPDGDLWVGWDFQPDADYGSEWCDGVQRLHGATWTTFLPGMCVADIDIASDGTVWVTVPGGTGVPREPGYAFRGDLYVITPEAVAATE